MFDGSSSSSGSYVVGGRRRLLEDRRRDLGEHHEVEDLRPRAVAGGAQLLHHIGRRGVVTRESRGTIAVVGRRDALEGLEVLGHAFRGDGVAQLLGRRPRVRGGMPPGVGARRARRRRRRGGRTGDRQCAAPALGALAALVPDAGEEEVLARILRTPGDQRHLEQATAATAGLLDLQRAERLPPACGAARTQREGHTTAGRAATLAIRDPAEGREALPGLDRVRADDQSSRSQVGALGRALCRCRYRGNGENRDAHGDAKS